MLSSSFTSPEDNSWSAVVNVAPRSRSAGLEELESLVCGVNNAVSSESLYADCKLELFELLDSSKAVVFSEVELHAPRTSSVLPSGQQPDGESRQEDVRLSG